MHFQIYRDSSAEYRWRLRAANNETMADSAEGYKRKSRAVAAVQKIKTMDRDGPDFLVSKAMVILDILLGSETGSSEEEKITAGENLRMLVATKQADMLAVLIDLMQGETGAAHNITLALAIKRQLEAKHRRLPAKGEIKAQMLKVGCGLREDEPKGWERLWKDAGLKYLPKAKPQRGKSRHGQKKARKEEK